MGRILLVRHGQASFGSDNYDQLSQVGHAQSRQLGEWLTAQGVGAPALVVTGGLRRQLETAAGLLDGAGWQAEQRVDAGWDEYDPGPVLQALPDFAERELDWSDRLAFQQVYLDATARWASGAHDDDYPVPWEQFRARVTGAFESAAQEAGPGRDVLVVSSGGPIALVVAQVLLAGPVPGAAPDAHSLTAVWGSTQAACVNSGLTTFGVGRSGARLATFNEHPHLRGEVTHR